MNLADFRKLKAAMVLTASSNDGEALAAIRAANRILEASGLTWEGVFARTVTVISEMSGHVVGAVGDGEEDELDSLLEEALRRARPDTDFYAMLLDFQARRERGLPLSERQLAVVRRAAEEA